MSTVDTKKSGGKDLFTPANHEERRRVRKKSRQDPHKSAYYGSGQSGYSEDRPVKKIDWHHLLPYFKRIRLKPSLDFFSQNIKFTDIRAQDPLWLDSDDEFVSNQQYLQIINYLQNKCIFPPLQLIRPDKHHETFISTIKEEVLNASVDASNIKVLINFGYNAAWVVFQRLPPEYTMHDDYGDQSSLQIQSYINLSSSEYHCLNKKFPYVVKRHTLLDNEVDFHGLPVIGGLEDFTPNDDSDHMSNIHLGGHNWNIQPPAFDIPSHNYSAAKILRNLLLRCGYEDFTIKTEETLPEFGEPNSFIEKQYMSYLYELMAIESELHLIKLPVLTKLGLENNYPYNLTYEPIVAKYITNKAKSAQRCSQFRRIIAESIEHFANEFSNPPEKFESDLKPEKEEPFVKSEPSHSEDPNVKQISYYYCSVCLLSEQAHKNALLQCRRCRMRVHFKCYADVDASLNNIDGSDWLCDVCQYENPYGSKEAFVPNRAICIICGSSGGALKRVDGDTAVYFAQSFLSQMNIQQNRNNLATSTTCSWIHIICGAWLIPLVNCKNWISLSHWDLSALRASAKSTRCSICMTSLGFYVSCSFPQCASRMHPMCAWLGGCYVSSTVAYAKSLPFNNAPDDCFTPLRIDPLCLFHTSKQFSQDIAKSQSKTRCKAYLDYVFNPNPFNKGRQANKNLSLWPSPVMITLNGPISSFGLPFPSLTSSLYPNRQMFPASFDHSTSYRDFLSSQQVLLYPKQSQSPASSYSQPAKQTPKSQSNQPPPFSATRYRVASHYLDSLTPGLCSICYTAYDSPAMVTIQCESCKVTLHPQCYFVFDTRQCEQEQVEYTTPFLCYRCLCVLHESECVVCAHSHGAMVYVSSSFPKLDTNRSKRTNLRFAHPYCGLFAQLPVAFHQDSNSQYFTSREPLANLETGYTCYICLTNEGLTEKCNHTSCERRFHVFCAKRCGFYVHLASDGINSYCLHHSQGQSTSSTRLNLFLKLLTIVDIANVSLLT